MFWTWAKVHRHHLSLGAIHLLTHLLKGLEDAFDGKNRRNPRHFIVDTEYFKEKSPKVKVPDSQSSGENMADDHNGAIQLPTRTGGRTPVSETEDSIEENDVMLMEKDQELFFYDDTSTSTTQLARIPTCAIFHKLTSGRGVPHSFYGAFLLD